MDAARRWSAARRPRPMTGLAVEAASSRGGRRRDRRAAAADHRSGVIVDLELVERQAAGIEEVEHRLLDDLGEMEEQRAVLLDAGVAGLDRLVVLLRDLQLLGHLVDRLVALFAMLADQLAGLAGAGVGRPAAVGKQPRGGRLELDGD